MDLGIIDKRALVTGASRGIGKSIAINLAKEGVKVAIVSRSKDQLKEVIKEMGGFEKGHYLIEGDLSKEGIPKKVYDEVNEKFGKIDILVNNIGGTLEYRDPYCDMNAWRDVYRLNLEVSIELSNLFIPDMKNQNWGRIINISSIAAKENQGPVPYCTMKAALNAYTRSMGRILAPDGVIMAAVMPGAIFTKDGYWDYASVHKKEHVKKYLEERMAIHRFGDVDEIGTVVAFFCSKHASFCVGSAVPVDGGQGRCFF